jgi:hypothetical protein
LAEGHLTRRVFGRFSGVSGRCLYRWGKSWWLAGAKEWQQKKGGMFENWADKKVTPMTRREMLIAAGSVCAAFAQSVPNPRGKQGMGGAPTAFTARLKANAQATPPVDFID